MQKQKAEDIKTATIYSDRIKNGTKDSNDQMFWSRLLKDILLPIIPDVYSPATAEKSTSLNKQAFYKNW